MSEAQFQKHVINRLDRVEKTMRYILGYVQDSKLSEEDKKALRLSLKEEKAGKLLSKKQVFG